MIPGESSGADCRCSSASSSGSGFALTLFLVGPALWKAAATYYYASKLIKSGGEVTGNAIGNSDRPQEQSSKSGALKVFPDALALRTELRSERGMSAGSVTSAVSSALHTRGADVLLHNVSHADVVFGMNTASFGLSEDAVIARPKFSCFHRIHYSIWEAIEKAPSAARISLKNVYRHSAKETPLKNERQETYFVPAGLCLRDVRITASDCQSKLRFRNNALSSRIHAVTDPLDPFDPANAIENIYFPLLAILIPKWLGSLKESRRYSSNKKVVYLISGQGTPRDSNADIIDNSTEYTARLMKLFINMYYKDIVVELVHSGTSNLFRYDENIKFVKGVLLPRVEALRDEVVEHRGDRWKQYFKATVSFADGSSARISAINAAMRQYRPSYMHFWQLKSFWHDTKLCLDDIEHHSFEEIGMVPAVSIVESTDRYVNLVAAEAIRFRKKFLEIRDRDHDLLSFWLRKTKKLVLAVLLVEKPGQAPRLFRGTNMEVSMPTGSLCAERNVIGTALSEDLTLKRQDLKMVAVLSVALEDLGMASTPRVVPAVPPALLAPAPAEAAGGGQSLLTPSTPDYAMRAEIDTFVEVDEPDAPRGTPSTPPPRRLRMYGSMSPDPSPSAANKRRNLLEQEMLDVVPPLPPSLSQVAADSSSTHSRSGSKFRFPDTTHHGPMLCSMASTDSATGREVSIKIKEGDLNPLKPCGACLEWLKKIAEVNPRFAVVTFTDADCNGVYVEDIENLIY